jgi:hypothetical protein
VYYLNGDGSGRSCCLRIWPFRSPNELVDGLPVGHGGPIDPAHPLQRPWIDVAPRAGLLLLFPSSLDHAVLENWGEDDIRRSLNVDFALIAPLTGPSSQPPECLGHLIPASGMGCQAGLIHSVSQVPWPGLSAWVEVGGIALFPCPKSRFQQPISI